MIVERALPFDHQLSCTIIDYHQLSFSLSFKFFMIVDDSFSCLTMRTIVHDSFRSAVLVITDPIAVRKHVCCSLSSQKIHTFTSLSYGMPFSIYIFRWKELGTCCSRDFGCATAGELSSAIMNFFGRLTT